ncbi:hypothetical protein LTR15_008025 [Elasticomyces elasticus]|nr:hypothetical protein LTR15_008025 [Elasticomyces elasticus]
MQPACFLYPGALVRSRDIDGLGRPDGFVDQTNALPTVLLWLDGYEGRDPVLVLDVADSTSDLFLLPKVSVLIIIPLPDTSFGPEFQRIMIEHYHWPTGSFKRQDWDRDIEGLVGRMIDAEIGREARAEDVKQDVPTSPVLDPELFE